MLTKIITYPNKSLREKTEPVIFPLTEKVTNHIYIATRVLLSTDKAAAIAANQLGFKESFFVYKSYSDNEVSCSVAINPKILSSSDEKLLTEGCLSFPGLKLQVLRNDKVNVEFFTQNQQVIVSTLTGHLAQVFQHEIDHLNGKLFIDNLSSSQKESIARKLISK